MKNLLILIILLSASSLYAQQRLYAVRNIQVLTDKNANGTIKTAHLKSLLTSRYISVEQGPLIFASMYFLTVYNSIKETGTFGGKYLGHTNGEYVYRLDLTHDQIGLILEELIYSSVSLGSLIDGDARNGKIKIIARKGDLTEGVQFDIVLTNPLLVWDNGAKTLQAMQREKRAKEEQKRIQQEKEKQKRQEEERIRQEEERIRQEKERKQQEEERIRKQNEENERIILENDLFSDIATYEVLTNAKYHNISVYGVDKADVHRWLLQNEAFQKIMRKLQVQGDFTFEIVLNEKGKVESSTILGDFNDKEKKKLEKVISKYKTSQVYVYYNHRKYVGKIKLSVKFNYSKDQENPLKFYTED
ncbi:MAG: hypothetical protein LBR10_16100 [Prevotellaceae bacterium]|jgi:hypothetical protein|nr:hypothetical protein [Prevotellaceae bacterium]